MIDDEVINNSDMGIEKLEVVKAALELSPKGIFLEIGTRAGGTALMALNAPQSEILISIDPYGSKPYIDTNGVAPFIYPDEMYRSTLFKLSKYAVEKNKTFIQFKLASQEYMAKSLNLWLLGNECSTHDIKYSYVLLDGEHNDKTVSEEIEFFSTRMATGGVLLVDNTDWLTLALEGWNKPRFDMAFRVF